MGGWAAIAAVLASVMGAPGSADDAPILTASELGAPGWTDTSCEVNGALDVCYFAHEAAVLAISAHALGPGERAETHVQVQATFCEGLTPIDVGGLPLTVGCTSPETSMLVFAGQDFVFTANLIESGNPPWDSAAFLLDLRQRQLAVAGGEPAPDPVVTLDASPLDRYIPTGPPGYEPSAGVPVDVNEFGASSERDLDIARADLEFLHRRVKTRVRLWQAGERTLAVTVAEYPHEALAGISLASVSASATPVTGVPAAGQIEDLVAFEVDGAGGPFHWQGFRRGRFEFWVIATGSDQSTRAQIASDMAASVAALAPDGPTAPVEQPTMWESAGRAALIALLAGAGALVVRRAFAGRARRATGIAPPRPVVVDVSAEASGLRHRGRVLATVQVAACTVIVVGLVADIGRWWIAVVATGVLLGVGATMLARRRELEGAVRYQPRASWPALVLGVSGGVLLVGGIGLAIRGLKEFVFLPSFTHLRLADRFSVAPEPLAATMGVTGIAALVIGGLLLRRARAHARSDPERLRQIDPRPPILYLRSFDDDGLAVPSVHSARRPFLELFNLRGRDSFEESIAWELAANGPVVAVGRPGGSTATLGAARELLDDTTWQRDVATRMRGAGAIVLAVGDSPGLAWEVGEVVRSGHLGKTRFVVPPAPPEQVDRRWAATCRAVDQAAGRLFVPPVRIAGGLTASIDPASGAVTATWADRFDEAAYRAAVDAALRP